MASDDVLPEVSWRFTSGASGADEHAVVHMHVREALSELYACKVVLALENDAPSLEPLIGQPARLDMLRGRVGRSFQGVVRSVQELGGLASHRFALVEVVPSLWLLSQRSDVRLFQDTNVIKVIEEVFRSAEVY